MATANELDGAALADLRHRFEPSVRTHWDDCYKDHAFCAVVRLCDELTAARQRIAALEGERKNLAAYEPVVRWAVGCSVADLTTGRKRNLLPGMYRERFVSLAGELARLTTATPAAREGE